MAYRIPLSPYPNQTFNMSIPVNDTNVDLTITLNYNSVAEYWMMTVTDTNTEEVIFSQLPLLCSFGDFGNMLRQLGYKLIGSAFVFPSNFTLPSRPDDKNLGTDYKLLWSDNGV